MNLTDPYDVFLSYRNSSSFFQAQLLWHDLNKVLGDGSTFLDQEELRAGAGWSAQLDSVLKADSLSCVVVIIADDFFTVADESGRPRIWDPDDVVFREMQIAYTRAANSQGSFSLLPVVESSASFADVRRELNAGRVPEHAEAVIEGILSMHALVDMPLARSDVRSTIAEEVRRIVGRNSRQLVVPAATDFSEFATMLPAHRRRVRLGSENQLASDSLDLSSIAVLAAIDVIERRFADALHRVSSYGVDRCRGTLEAFRSGTRDSPEDLLATSTMMLSYALARLGGERPRRLSSLRDARSLVNDVLQPTQEALFEYRRRSGSMPSTKPELLNAAALNQQIASAVQDFIRTDYFENRGIPVGVGWGLMSEPVATRSVGAQMPADKPEISQLVELGVLARKVR